MNMSITKTGIVFKTTEEAVSFHDALSDYVIAPLGRVNHLQGLMNGYSLEANNIDTAEGALSREDADKAYNFLRSLYPNMEISINLTSRGKNLSAFYYYVKRGDEFFAFVFGSITNNFVSYILPAGDDYIPKFNDHFFQYLPPKEYSVNVYEDGQLNPVTIKEADTVVYDAFYPFIKQGVEGLINGFYESRSRVLIFTGIAGSGKSSLMRAFLNYSQNDKFVLLDDPSVYQDPKAMGSFLSTIRRMSKDQRVTVFLEEADKIIQDKKDSDSGALERLLSLASGVVEHNIKIVIASNLENADDIYPALTRGGRAYEVITFDKIEPDQANQCRKLIGLEPVNFDTELTLASALNFHDAGEVHERQPRSFGFIPVSAAKPTATEVEAEAA